MSSDQGWDDYCAVDAVNWSTLKHMRLSAKHYRYRLQNPIPDTARLILGRAVHTAVLEPDQFPLQYVVFDGSRRAGKAFDEFAEVNEGRTILKRDEYDTALAIRDAVRNHPTAGELLYGQSEVTVEWTDADTGICCKGRIDHVNLDGALVDLKSTKSVDMHEFERTSAQMLYHAQLAFYRRGLGTEHNPRIIAVEAEPPHDVVVYRLTDDALLEGDALVSELLHKLANCRQSDKWPGRFSGEQDLTLPPWMFTDTNDTANWGGLA